MRGRSSKLVVAKVASSSTKEQCFEAESSISIASVIASVVEVVS